MNRLVVTTVAAALFFARPAHAEYRQIDLTIFGMD